MLPVIDPEGRRAAGQAVIYGTLLVPASIVPALIGLSGTAYLAFAGASGIALVWLALRFASTRSDADEQTVSLADYISRMKDGQDAIY